MLLVANLGLHPRLFVLRVVSFSLWVTSDASRAGIISEGLGE